MAGGVVGAVAYGSAQVSCRHHQFEHNHCFTKCGQKSGNAWLVSSEDEQLLSSCMSVQASCKCCLCAKQNLLASHFRRCFKSLQAMYAFRAGHAVLANPLAIFLAQLLGAVVGCLIAPAALVMYAKQDPLGGATFPAPEAVVWRKNAATAAAGGIGQLPDYTWAFALGAAALSLVLCVLRDIVPARLRPILPAPSSMGITFLSGANIAVDLCVGALVRLLWGLRHPDSAQVHAGVVGAGLIIGDGLWLLGRGLLAAFNVLAPICMIFQ